MRDLQRPGRSPAYAPRAMAATSHQLATTAALDIMRRGGNAMDAAIAACAVQCVVEPGSTGIGGDNFCMYAPADGAITAFNGSGRAPGGATPEWFAEQGIARIERRSPHSVVVPGAVDAWCRLHERHGRMAWRDVLAPAIAYARDGYPVGQRVAADHRGQRDHIAADPDLAAIFLVDGEAPREGTTQRQPALARTLEAIAEGGRAAFYEGEIAREMVDTLRERGGLHTLDDFANAQGEWVEPIETEYEGLTVHECPPNGQGVIALLLLNVMSGYGTLPPLGSADRVHLELEACRQAYAARGQFLGDPAMADLPVDHLLSERFAAAIRERIAMDRVSDIRAPFEPPHADTVYISVVDEDRNACSFINTLFEGWGSGIIAPRSGVVLTNRAQGFTLEPGHPNAIAPGKRPLHTIIPAMGTRDGRAELCFGVMGGQYQAMGQMQFLSRHLHDGLDLQEAMDAPRWMADPFTDEAEIEAAVPDAVVEDLRRRGHRIERAKAPIGGSQAIALDRETGVLTGASDPRKDGIAAGY